MWLEFWSLATIIIAFIGAIACLYRIRFFSFRTDELSSRLRKVFLTDMSIYIVTVFFGLFNFLNIDSDWMLYPMRALFLLSNIYFAWRLTSPIRD